MKVISNGTMHDAYSSPYFLSPSMNGAHGYAMHIRTYRYVEYHKCKLYFCIFVSMWKRGKTFDPLITNLREKKTRQGKLSI